MPTKVDVIVEASRSMILVGRWGGRGAE